MPENFSDIFSKMADRKPERKNYWLHTGLFLITLVTTTIAGVEWTTGKIGPYELSTLASGLPYALSILFVLGVHEFGHYFAAVYHKVKATLPYFIPFPPIAGFFNFGTMGAVIKTKSVIPNNKAMFDIGVAGPLAGFVACMVILVFGFTHLPPVEYILKIHPDYFLPSYGKNGLELRFGDTIIFALLRQLLTSPNQFVPPMSEIYHYPFLCVGWFGLFVTSMNLIPVGQLDGGHVIYSMFNSKKHEAIASVSLILLLAIGILGVLDNLFDIRIRFGWSGWLFWAFILYFFIKVKHPPVYQFEELNAGRKIIGYVAIIVFIISFSPTPFEISF
jgi:membrane-associated protease RseP (regulator of RpoE activity)